MTNISDILKFWNRHRYCLFKTRSSFSSFGQSFLGVSQILEESLLTEVLGAAAVPPKVFAFSLISLK